MAALIPLPSFLRASAQDAGNAHMRKACRTKWNNEDWNVMCDTQDRLIRSCYGRPGDHNQPDMCFLRFQIAEKMERQGKFSIKSDLAEIHAAVEAEMA
jgi:invasion protein IalB